MVGRSKIQEEIKIGFHDLDGDTEDFKDSQSNQEKELITISDPVSDRYNTFGFISWWDQERVRNARIMVVGAGALGNEVLKNLSLMGVGEILIIDFDTIDDSNLSRSILFRASDNGRKKAEAAAEAVREINPDVGVQWIHADINNEIGLGVYKNVDVVIGCLDNREARRSINRAVWHLGKSWVDGAIQELLGIARVWTPHIGACYECTLTEEDKKIIGHRMSCPQLAYQNLVEGKVPTTPTIASIIGSVQAQEALKLLHGMETRPGEALIFNGLNNDVYTMMYEKDDECMSHWQFDPIIENKALRSEKTTIGEILEIAKTDLGSDAVVEIPIFITNIECGNCNHVVEFNKPQYRIEFNDTACPVCSNILELKPEGVYANASGDEPFLNLTIQEIGFPAFDIFPAHSKEHQYRFYEISGDKEQFFQFSH